jgi:hypothetical protein
LIVTSSIVGHLSLMVNVNVWWRLVLLFPEFLASLFIFSLISFFLFFFFLECCVGENKQESENKTESRVCLVNVICRMNLCHVAAQVIIWGAKALVFMLLPMTNLRIILLRKPPSAGFYQQNLVKSRQWRNSPGNHFMLQLRLAPANSSPDMQSPNIIEELAEDFRLSNENAGERAQSRACGPLRPS